MFAGLSYNDCSRDNDSIVIRDVQEGRLDQNPPVVENFGNPHPVR